MFKNKSNLRGIKHTTGLERNDGSFKWQNKLFRDRLGWGPLGGWSMDFPFKWVHLLPVLNRYTDTVVFPVLFLILIVAISAFIGIPIWLVLLICVGLLFVARKRGHLPNPKEQARREFYSLRREWSRLMLHSGLIQVKDYRNHEIVPGIGMTKLKGGIGHKATIEIPPGQTWSAVSTKLQAAAEAYFRAKRVIVEPETRDSTGGHVVLTVMTSDPLATSTPVGDWAIAANDMSRPVRFGTYLDGSPAKMDMWSRHGLKAGTTGSGKSASTHMEIFAALSIPHTQVYLIDLKDGIELGEYASRATAFATTMREGLDILTSVHEEMNRRNKYLVSINARKSEPLSKKVPASMAPIVIFFDEFGSTEASSSDTPDVKEIKAKIAFEVKELARLGRSAGISLNLISQRMSTNVISGDSRMLFANRTAFKADDSASLTMILGNGWADAGIDLSGPVPPGVGLSSASGPLKEFRGFYLSDAQISDFIARLPRRNHDIVIPVRPLEVELKELAAEQKSQENAANRKRSPRKPRMSKETIDGTP